MGLAAFDEVIQDGQGVDSSADNQLHFRQRCEMLDSPHDWAAYLIETSMSHPSRASARPYLDINYPTGEIQFRHEPFDDMNLGQSAATEMYQALFVVNATLEGEPLSGALSISSRSSFLWSSWHGKEGTGDLGRTPKR